MDIESHSQHPILNQVEVESPSEFRDFVLRNRIAPLLRARTVGELLAAVDPVARNLSALGDASFAFDLDSSEPVAPGGPLAVKTKVSLSHPTPALPVSLSVVTAGEQAGLQGAGTLYNRLGLGESLAFTTQVQPRPYDLGSGTATFTVPMPIGAGKLSLAGFFFNQNRPWASYALASHGLSAQVSVPWTQRLIAAFGVEATDRHFSTLGDAASDSVRAAAVAPSTKVAAVASLTHTGLQHSFQLNAEAAGRPGDAIYTKVSAALNAFRTLAGDLTGDVAASAGYIHGSAPIFDRFVLGGPKDVYGFAPNSLGPRDGEDFIGGSAFYVARGTLSLPLPGRAASPLRLVALGNVAALQTNGSAVFEDNVKQLAKQTPSAAVAAGLTYRTSQANFELLWVKPLQSAPTDVTREGLHFGVGLSLQ